MHWQKQDGCGYLQMVSHNKDYIVTVGPIAEDTEFIKHINYPDFLANLVPDFHFAKSQCETAENKRKWTDMLVRMRSCRINKAGKIT